MPPAPSDLDGSNQPNSNYYVFLAGSISGVAEGVTIQPLEMLKTRFQIHQGEPLRIIPTVKGQHSLNLAYYIELTMQLVKDKYAGLGDALHPLPVAATGVLGNRHLMPESG